MNSKPKQHNRAKKPASARPISNGAGQTLYEKIWDAHVVREAAGEPTILYIDLHLIHEVTTPQAFTGLRNRKLPVRRTDLTIATMDHSVPSANRKKLPWPDVMAQKQVEMLDANCKKHGITLYDLGSKHQGIVHIIGPELGLTQPGKTIVCGDSHTSTHGAFGALAFGIGTSEVEHVFATQCLLQNKTKTMAITVNGTLPKGVFSKDIILRIINEIGIGGGTGYTFEYRGSAIRALSMEARMTICNMSIEAGARAGMVAPDQTTVDYLEKRVKFANSAEKKRVTEGWLKWKSDEGAVFDKEIIIDANTIEPMVSWGTNPGMSVGITQKIPKAENEDVKKALEYMGLQGGQKMAGQPIQYVFIGSCTNSRIEDLRIASKIMSGKKVAKGVTAYVVPGSQEVKREAESEGLDKVFLSAGCEWREPGCSMCIGMNGDLVPSGKYCASTSNRNFIGRQGRGARTLLMSPAMAAVAAIEGTVGDARKFV
ncbi:MAG: 3-isopropylmalate dehydratase large subunit [Candidatus Kaiserbacteria bacterium GW2011_GWA2_49_19]|uniref:3-isopropylmalate dehydratase large subunit n=1 Tax=Candidatus Kaiserbacteria bacterium GW2011_GWA2_49_19 TaxID=1618669 RepID=A0A0G1Y1H5_9BACT|nr:MAG: 3-isopropylmalate dehydratase large subunit [Candidatus Kaiserbacteria bacterium GW2011_GWA2_49_19]